MTRYGRERPLRSHQGLGHRAIGGDATPGGRRGEGPPQGPRRLRLTARPEARGPQYRPGPRDLPGRLHRRPLQCPLNVTVTASDVATAASAAPHGRAHDPRAVDLLLDAFTAITSDYEQAVPVCRAAVDRLHRDMSSPSADLFPLLRTPCSSAPLFPRDHQQAERKGGPPQARRRSTLLARYAVRRSSSIAGDHLGGSAMDRGFTKRERSRGARRR